MVKLLAVSLASVAAVSPYCEAFNSVDNRRPSSVASAPLKKPTVASHVQITRAQLSSSPTYAAAFSLSPSLEGRSGLDASDGVDIAAVSSSLAEGTSFDSQANSHLESFASNGGGGLEFTPLQTAVRASVPLEPSAFYSADWSWRSIFGASIALGLEFCLIVFVCRKARERIRREP